MKRIITLFLLCAALLGAAGRWTLYGTSGNKSNTSYFYYDVSSVRYRASSNVQNDYASVWIKMTVPSGGYLLEHVEQHYSTRQFRLLSVSLYDASDDLVRSEDGPTTWSDIVPDSVGDTLFHRLWRAEQGEQF